ncbi:hypothetical protein EE612_029317 [Oryza sativa]|nr:hypothetical protein EE612_029317 [Oryza sativa]
MGSATPRRAKQAGAAVPPLPRPHGCLRLAPDSKTMPIAASSRPRAGASRVLCRRSIAASMHALAGSSARLGQVRLRRAARSLRSRGLRHLRRWSRDAATAPGFGRAKWARSCDAAGGPPFGDGELEVALQRLHQHQALQRRNARGQHARHGAGATRRFPWRAGSRPRRACPPPLPPAPTPWRARTSPSPARSPATCATGTPPRPRPPSTCVVSPQPRRRRHCPAHRHGALLLELNRVLRPGGFFVWSATPVYQKLTEDVQIWKAMTALTKSMCWELVTIKKDQLNDIGHMLVWYE